MSGDKREDGGPAFPVIAEGGDGSGLRPHRHDGLSLRDYFATEAMGAFLMNPNIDHNSTPDDICKWAYRYAAAMLKARQSTGDE